MFSFVLLVATFLSASWLFHHWRKLSVAGRTAASAVAGALLAALALSLPEGLLLQKLLGHLIMPAGLFWLLLLAASAAAWHQRRARWAAAIFLAFLLYTATGSAVVGSWMLRFLEQDYLALRPMHSGVPEGDSQPFEAIFVLGGGTSSWAGERVFLEEAGDRVVLAARMYHAGRTERLVASGASIGGAIERDLARETRQIWEELGVPPDAILEVEGGPRNTREEIAAYSDLVERKGWKRIGLITSAWHLRRAMGLAQRAELDLIPLPADHESEGTWGGGPLALVPSGEGFYKVHRASWEIVGALVGR